MTTMSLPLAVIMEIPGFTTGALIVLGVSMLLAVIRLIKGPSMPDRVVALDVMAVISISVMVLFSIKTGNAMLLDVAIAMALVVFLGTVAFARSFEKRMTE